jgi:glycosyltransferase involved in cell wall biosynthesis
MAGRVIYPSPEVPTPVGGVRVLSHHVALLREAGIDAALWCPTPGFQYTWFDQNVPMLYGETLQLGADDLLVLPEPTVLPGRDPAPGARKVIFNQNHFLTYMTWPDPSGYPGWTPDPAVWTVSEESVEVLSRVHPELPVALVPNPIDAEVFRPARWRSRSIAWMPRKRRVEAALLSQIFANDPRSAGVELREISNLPQAEVARILGDTSVFIALGGPTGEGFGLPVAEALAAGCLVIGYPAGGGEEMFSAPTAWSVPSSRPTLLADQALQLLDLPDQEEMRQAGRQWVQDRYSFKVTTAALVEAVHDARTRPGAAAVATHPMAWAEEIFAAAGGLLDY